LPVKIDNDFNTAVPGQDGDLPVERAWRQGSPLSSPRL